MSPVRKPPKKKDGPELTSRHLRELLPEVLKEIGQKHQMRPDLILAAWPELVGPKLAPMTQAMSFHEGVLTVIVKNSTLYSLLQQHEKLRLLQAMQEKFPLASLRRIHFRMG